MTALASFGVLGAGWALGTANGATLTTADTSSTTTEASATASATTSETASESTTASAEPTESETAESSADSGTFTGETVTHRYGSVTVDVTVESGEIVDVSAATTASHDQSESYIEKAVPTLRSEVLSAQSADVETVSGATYTSEAYLTSLQSALDEAQL